MSNQFIVKIIMPSKILLEDEVKMVNVPGSDGMFGVLPGHMNLVSSLDIGIVTVFYDKFDAKYFIYGGVAEVKGQELNIVTEFAVNMEYTNKDLVYNEIRNLQNMLNNVEGDSIEIAIISSNIARYEALLRVLECEK